MFRYYPPHITHKQAHAAMEHSNKYNDIHTDLKCMVIDTYEYEPKWDRCKQPNMATSRQYHDM